jgi:hypothetical protein
MTENCKKISRYARKEFHLMTASISTASCCGDNHQRPDKDLADSTALSLGDVMIPFVQSLILIVAGAWVFLFQQHQG